MEKEIFLNRRTERSNSCISVVDDSIVKVTVWKLNILKYSFLIVCYVITLGILFIVCFFFKRVFIYFACDIPSNISDFDYVLIKTDNNDEYLIKVQKEEFYIQNNLSKKNTTDKLISSNQTHIIINDPLSKEDEFDIIQKSIYINSSFKKNKLNKVFTFHDNKYVYKEETQTFDPVYFDLTKYTNQNILSLFKSENLGIPTYTEYQFLLNVYGVNKLYLKSKTIMYIFISFMFEPLYIYNIYGIINWIFTEYYVGAIILGIVTVIIQMIRTSLEHKNYDQLNTDIGNCNVKRPFLSSSIIQVSGEQIVPGDIVFVSEKFIMSFDGLILDGVCTTSESDLTGESSLVMKTALENNEEDFAYEGNEKSFLYQGSIIMSCKGNYSLDAKEVLVVMVINTGFNTNRGNLIQNFQTKKTSNFHLGIDLIKLCSVAIGLWICSIIIMYCFNQLKPDTVKNIFDNLTLLLPPCISMSMGFCSFYFHYTLMNQGISCIESKRLLITGAVDTIIFDKTGTLTKHACVIVGFLIVVLNGKEQLILHQENAVDTLNKIHKFFWKKMYKEIKEGRITNQNYQSDKENLLIFLTECLASTHCVDLFNEKAFGNSIDKMLYDKLNWHLSKEGDDMYIIPSNSFKISSFSKCLPKEKLRDSKDFKSFKDNDYKLKYLHRSEFSSKNQSMCVIVRNMLDNSIRLYSKGAPEKMISLCKKDSIPINFNEEYLKLTQSGKRVLACCTRLITENEWNPNTSKTKKIIRESFDKDLTFLGFVIFTNELKNDTKTVIHNLLKSNSKILISTGDNPYTTMTVAKQCNLIKEDNTVYITEYEDNKFNITSTSFQNKPIDDSSSLNMFHKRDLKVNDKCKELFSGDSIQCLRNILLNNNAKLCISGLSLAKLIEFATKNNLSLYDIFTKEQKNITNPKEIISCMLNQLKKKGIIFFRMLPQHKAQLINLLRKDKESIISMCGDGANDCNAIMVSDVGIAIRQSKNQCLISHFFSSIDSIMCVEKILQNGRACNENHVVLFKAMILGGVIQLTATTILLVKDLYFSEAQFAYFDFICSVIPVFLSTNGSSGELNTRNPSKSIVSKVFIINVLGQTVLQIGIQFGYQYMLSTLTIAPESDVPQTEDELLLIFPSYLFICCVFQYLATIVVFNLHDSHRKKTYNNKLFTYYITAVILLTVVIITIKDARYAFFGKELVIFELDDERFDSRGERNRLIALAYSVGVMIVYYLYDLLIMLIFPE